MKNGQKSRILSAPTTTELGALNESLKDQAYVDLRRLKDILIHPKDENVLAGMFILSGQLFLTYALDRAVSREIGY